MATPNDEPMKSKGPFMGPTTTQTSKLQTLSSGPSVDSDYKSVIDSVMGKQVEKQLFGSLASPQQINQDQVMKILTQGDREHPFADYMRTTLNKHRLMEAQGGIQLPPGISARGKNSPIFQAKQAQRLKQAKLEQLQSNQYVQKQIEHYSNSNAEGKGFLDELNSWNKVHQQNRGTSLNMSTLTDKTGNKLKSLSKGNHFAKVRKASNQTFLESITGDVNKNQSFFQTQFETFFTNGQSIATPTPQYLTA